MSSRSIIASALILFAVSTAQGGDGVIYKCADASGRLTYQNEPCPSPAQTRAVRPYTDPGYNPSLAHKVEQDRRALDARRQTLPVYRFGRPAPGPDKARLCREAKAERDAFLARYSFQTTYDQRRALDNRVYEACKHVPGA